MLRTKPGSFARAASGLNCWGTSPVPPPAPHPNPSIFVFWGWVSPCSPGWVWLRVLRLLLPKCREYRHVATCRAQRYSFFLKYFSAFVVLCRTRAWTQDLTHTKQAFGLSVCFVVVCGGSILIESLDAEQLCGGQQYLHVYLSINNFDS